MTSRGKKNCSNICVGSTWLLLSVVLLYIHIRTEEKIIVIGSGISGISAAYFLSKFSFITGNTVTVLESKGRVGGRIWTIDAPFSQSIHIGAGWLHATRNNKFAHVLNSYGCKSVVTNMSSVRVYAYPGQRYSKSSYETMYKTNWELWHNHFSHKIHELKHYEMLQYVWDQFWRKKPDKEMVSNRMRSNKFLHHI